MRNVWLALAFVGTLAVGLLLGDSSWVLSAREESKAPRLLPEP
jgi:hypothetical protein